MPSVRVKSKTYTPLHEVFAQADPSWAGGVTEAQGSATEGRTENRGLFPRFSYPFLRQDRTPTSTLPAPGRPRALTSASRVHAHCTLRNARQSGSINSPSPNSPHFPLPQNEQPQPGGVSESNRPFGIRRIRSHGDSGRAESSINLSHGGSDHPWDFLNSDHHHDDVVEHLDVIDAQVGAFATLTNAANAIVIPPSSWYSRRPVVVLPAIPLRTSGGEEGKLLEDSLDRHVNDVLEHPSRIRRTLMGVWSFLKTPMGFITGIYGFLIVFWGAAIVLFLSKIINLHNPNTQGFWIEISSQVETGLFTVTSIGLIPSRVLDTYRIFKIWLYKRRTQNLREKAGLPQLFDEDDLPDPFYDPNYVHVLTEEEQKDLHRQQRKFQYSQTWYRSHGTETHRAFPISLALWICFLNDGNSVFQAFLCGTMWGMNRFQRPPWTTAVFIPGAFLCGIGAAVLIWLGGERTKRVEEVRERLRKALEAKQPLELRHNQGQDNKDAVQTKPTIPHDADEKPDGDVGDPDTFVDELVTVPQAHELAK